MSSTIASVIWPLLNDASFARLMLRTGWIALSFWPLSASRLRKICPPTRSLSHSLIVDYAVNPEADCTPATTDPGTSRSFMAPLPFTTALIHYITFTLPLLV
ncbi:MAG: hypothetical protein ACP5OR_05310 [Candidatus Dormibacteria bacterium]